MSQEPELTDQALAGRHEQQAVLHVIPAEKFTEPFIEFLHSHNIDFDRQFFICYGDLKKYPIKRRPNVLCSADFGNKPQFYVRLIRDIYSAERVILHGLWNLWMIRLLALQPWLLKKCYWAIWGGDLYRRKLSNRSLMWFVNEIPRRIVIKRIGHLVTYVEGDVELAREWYGARGEYHECLMYPSNLYKHYDVSRRLDQTINIQIGNSADPTNEHLEVFAALERFKDEDIRIFVPLSYGNEEYAGKIAAEGKRIFGDKFVAMTEFLTADRYLEFLGRIDIAIFNHRRQQGMGNIITLLGLGKKVYVRNDTTTWETFRRLEITVFEIDALDLTLLDEIHRDRNRKLIIGNFSERNLRNELKAILQ
jgi:hypothetical protein